MNAQISLLLDTSGPGGIETHVLELASGLKDFGLSVEVCLLKKYRGHPMCQLLEQRKIPWCSLAGTF